MEAELINTNYRGSGTDEVTVSSAISGRSTAGEEGWFKCGQLRKGCVKDFVFGSLLFVVCFSLECTVAVILDIYFSITLTKQSP